jgi:hypothetical protein
MLLCALFLASFLAQTPRGRIEENEKQEYQKGMVVGFPFNTGTAG